MGEPVSICDHDMVCSHRDLSTGSDHMNWTEVSKLFHQTLQNLINGNAFVCTDLWGILQVSRLWQDILTINNFLSCAVNHRSLSFLAIFTKGLITFLLKTVAQVGFCGGFLPVGDLHFYKAGSSSFFDCRNAHQLSLQRDLQLT